MASSKTCPLCTHPKKKHIPLMGCVTQEKDCLCMLTFPGVEAERLRKRWNAFAPRLFRI